MPQFRVTDPDSGKTLLLTGDSAPTEQELDSIFAQGTTVGLPEQRIPGDEGVALAPEPVTPEQPTLPGRRFQPKPPIDPDQQPFIRATEQGLLNIGGGLLRGFGELANMVGVEGAQQFLSDLAVSQTFEQAETAQVTKDAPIQEFAGTVAGETLGLPFGGTGKSLLARLLSSAGAGGAAGALSAAGRGEEGAAIVGEAALGAGLAPIAEGATAAIRARGVARQAAQLGDVEAGADVIGEAAAQVERAQAAQAESGIRLLPAQQTLDPFQLEKQAFLGQNPEVSRKAFNVLKEQNREAAAAVSGLLDVIAEPGVVGVSGAEARRGASNVLNVVSTIRAERASPIYREAFNAGATVDLAPVNAVIDDIVASLPEQGSKIRGVVLKTRNLLKGTPGLRQLHNAKLEIDEMISAKGVKGLGPTTKRYLTQIQESLVAQIDEASPLYTAARAEFRAGSPAVDTLRDSVFGRLESLKDTDLKRASAILFDAGESNPTVLRDSIKVLRNVEGGDEIARGLLRTELEKRLGRMKVELSEAAQTGGRRLENTPQLLLNNLFGNASQKKVLMSALSEVSPEAARNARWLEDALNRAAAGRPGGSQTGIRQVITEDLRGGASAIRNFFRKPLDTLAGIGEDQAFSRKVRAVGDALYNPDWAPDMARIRKLNPNSPAAKSRFEKLLESIVAQNELLGITTQATATAGRKELTDNG